MIRWITDQLGTAPFEHLRADADVEVLDVRDILDGPGNRSEAIREVVSRAVTKLMQGKRVAVCCDYGISRSNAVAAGVLSMFAKISFDDATTRVIVATGEQEIRLSVLSAVRGAVTEPTVRRGLGEADDATPILLTGASGFVGSAVKAAFSGHNVVISPSRSEADLLEGALALDTLARRHGVQTIIHLAQPRIVGTNAFMGDGLRMMKNVVDVCIDIGVHLVYMSSIAVFDGYKVDRLIGQEALPRRPSGAYGHAKAFCEELAERSLGNGGPGFTILRSGPSYGDGGDRPRFLKRFVSRALVGEPLVIHQYQNGVPTLDLIHVRDLARAITLAAQHQYQGIVHLGSGANVSIADLATQIVATLASSSPTEIIDMEGYASDVVLSAELAGRDLGWSPEVTIREGLDGWVLSEARRVLEQDSESRSRE